MHRKSIRKSTENSLKIVRKFIKNVEKWGGEPMTAKSIPKISKRAPFLLHFGAFWHQVGAKWAPKSDFGGSENRSETNMKKGVSNII